jgi:hypothetical protein
MLPKFQYDGGAPARFLRDFPLVSKFFGVAEAYLWREDQELDAEQDRLNTYAMAVLRQYLSENVLSVITVQQPKRAATLYRNLEKMFLQNNARSKIQVQKEISACEMGA